MPRTIRFNLDENCAHAIAAGLRRRGIAVPTTPDVGLLGAIAEYQLAYCLAEGRVIFSYDDDLLRLAAYGVEHAGVVYYVRVWAGSAAATGRRGTRSSKWPSSSISTLNGSIAASPRAESKSRRIQNTDVTSFRVRRPPWLA